MQWNNQDQTESPNVRGAAATRTESMELRDDDGNIVAEFTKGVDGAVALAVDGVAVPQTQSAVLQADFPKTNDTLEAVPDLTLNLEAGHWYRVTGQLIFNGGAGFSQAAFDGGTVTATGIRGIANGYNFSEAASALNEITLLTSLIVANLQDVTTIPFEFTIQVSGGGTLIPRFAQATTDASASTLLKYSTISAVDITP